MCVKTKVWHTSEPWTVEAYDNTDISGIYRVWEAQKKLEKLQSTELPSDTPDDMELRWQAAEEENRANANRICACVNALAGVEDPKAFVESYAALCVALAGAQEALSDVLEWQEGNEQTVEEEPSWIRRVRRAVQLNSAAFWKAKQAGGK